MICIMLSTSRRHTIWISIGNNRNFDEKNGAAHRGLTVYCSIDQKLECFGKCSVLMEIDTFVIYKFIYEIHFDILNRLKFGI